MAAEEYKQKILSVLEGRGGFTTGDVARHVEPIFGHNKRTHSGAVRQWLLELKASGLVRELDSEKPVVWVKAI